MKGGKSFNKIIKVIGFALIYLIVFLECYAISFIITGGLASLVLTVWSFITALPVVIIKNYGMWFLLASIPLSVAMFSSILVEVAQSSHSKDNQKQS